VNRLFLERSEGVNTVAQPFAHTPCEPELNGRNRLFMPFVSEPILAEEDSGFCWLMERSTHKVLNVKEYGTCEQQKLLRQTQTAANASEEVTNKEATERESISLTGLIGRFWADITNGL